MRNFAPQLNAFANTNNAAKVGGTVERFSKGDWLGLGMNLFGSVAGSPGDEMDLGKQAKDFLTSLLFKETFGQANTIGASAGAALANFIPGLDTITDATSAIGSLMRGNYLDAGAYAMSAIPGIGNMIPASAIKAFGQKGMKLLNGASEMNSLNSGIKNSIGNLLKGTGKNADELIKNAGTIKSTNLAEVTEDLTKLATQKGIKSDDLVNLKVKPESTSVGQAIASETQSVSKATDDALENFLASDANKVGENKLFKSDTAQGVRKEITKETNIISKQQEALNLQTEQFKTVEKQYSESISGLRKEKAENVNLLSGKQRQKSQELQKEIQKKQEKLKELSKLHDKKMQKIKESIKKREQKIKTVYDTKIEFPEVNLPEAIVQRNKAAYSLLKTGKEAQQDLKKMSTELAKKSFTTAGKGYEQVKVWFNEGRDVMQKQQAIRQGTRLAVV
jgi:hypothetical protein